MFQKKTMILVRGCSGAGKSTQAAALEMAAEALGNSVCTWEADMFFEVGGEYQFNPSNLHQAHKWCQTNVELAMEDEIDTIIVSNTSTTPRELSPYLKLARENNYRVVSLIVENRHGNSNIHDVPQEVLERQANRFNVKLI